jgi:hypothetical protein
VEELLGLVGCHLTYPSDTERPVFWTLFVMRLGNLYVTGSHQAYFWPHGAVEHSFLIFLLSFPSLYFSSITWSVRPGDSPKRPHFSSSGNCFLFSRTLLLVPWVEKKLAAVLDTS